MQDKNVIKLTDQDAALLEQGASMLEGLENDERNRGNCSTAEGAGCSAHAVRRLASALLAHEREIGQCLHQIQEPAAAEQAAWHAGRTQEGFTVSNAETSKAAQPIAWPKDAQDVRDFFRSDFITAQFAAKDQSPCDEDRYLVSAHDFLSAVNWWADFPHMPREPQAAPAAVAVPDERAAFEKWASFVGYSIKRWQADANLYEDNGAEDVWIAWQARAALAATPAAAPVDKSPELQGSVVDKTVNLQDAAAAPVVLPEPVGWRHSRTLTLHETEQEVQLADGDSHAEPLFTEQQVRALLAAAPLQPVEGPTKDQATWCSYIAGMIGCYLKETDESPRVKAIEGIIARRLWALPSATTATELPAQAVPAFCHVASLKLKSLQERGYQITGYALEKPVEGAQPERGFINHGGFVGWWWDGQSPQAQADARAAELLGFLQDQCIDLRCFTTSDGEDVGWRTVQHHMSEPRERVVSEVYGDQPRRAIREAMARIERDPYCTGPLHLEDDAAIAPAKGE